MISLIKFNTFYPLQRGREILLHERDRWILWLPVLIGIGIVVYFQLTFEPWLGTGFILCGSLGIALWRVDHQKYFWFGIVLKVFLFICVGFSAAQIKTWRLSTFMLNRPLPSMAVEGTIVKIEKMTGRVRLTLEQIDFEDKNLSKSFNLVRIACRGAGAQIADSFVPGQRILLKAKLLPPNEPVAPGTYDFRRRAYFEGISAVGYGTTVPKIVPNAHKNAAYSFGAYQLDQLAYKLAQLRHFITEGLCQKIGGSEGAIAASLITGDRSGIPESIRQAFADSGLAHILAISGLHLSIAAGIAFYFIRKSLSLIPWVVLSYPIKKWAAGAAMIFTLGYLFISGLTIPAQRAFVMTCTVLMGIIADRTVVTLRNVALTASLILLITPDCLMSPSFQMSFAAVTALVSGYEILHQPLMKWRCESHSKSKKILFYLLGISLSTILATIATTPYIIYTFNRLTLHAIPANLVSIPLLSFIIMPLLIVFLFGLGLGFSFNHLIGYGLKVSIGVMVKVAVWVSSWPGSVLLIPILPPAALALFTFGAMWIVIWKGLWRWQGLWGIVGCLTLMVFYQPADIYINPEKSLVIFNDHQNKLIVNSMRAGRFARESWMKRAAIFECFKLKDYLKQKQSNLIPSFITAQATHSLIHFQKSDVAFYEQEKCYHCDWECQIVHQKTDQKLNFSSYFDNVQDQSGHLIWITSSGFYIKTVAQEIGNRPWRLKRQSL